MAIQRFAYLREFTGAKLAQLSFLAAEGISPDTDQFVVADAVFASYSPDMV